MSQYKITVLALTPDALLSGRPNDVAALTQQLPTDRAVLLAVDTRLAPWNYRISTWESADSVLHHLSSVLNGTQL